MCRGGAEQKAGRHDERAGPNRSRSRAKTGTTATTGTEAPTTISGRAVVGHTARNAASRKAFDAT